MGFTHIDERGNAVMVDVGGKDVTARRAVAEGRIRMSRECFELVKAGRMKKGDVLGVAQVAGIMAAKKAAELIPLCHTLLLTNVKVELEPLDEESTVRAVCSVKCDGRTGVEMEALTGASVALLTVYDMCKSVDRSMEIVSVHLVEKHGGKSGDFYYGDEK